MDAGVAAIGVVFGFLFIVRHTATAHHHTRALPRRRVTRLAVKLFRAILILAGVVMVVEFTKPLPPVSRVLVSMVVTITAVSVGWYLIPALTRAIRPNRAHRSSRSTRVYAGNPVQPR